MLEEEEASMFGSVTRRGWLRILGVGTLGGLLGSVTSPAAARGRCPTFPGQHKDILPSQADSPQVILEKLMQGNNRYVNNDPIPHRRDVDQGLEEIDPVLGQLPAAMILSCADSRAVPEYIFDQPRARLFVCRVAGNFATDELIGSLEYGVEVLGARLLIVLGHSACGAVTSTIRLVREGPSAFSPTVLASKIPIVLEGLRAPVARVIASNPPDTSAGTLLRQAIDEVARENAALLASQRPILAPRVQNGTLGVVAARYDIDTGVVSFV
jgi:carbonic anhydrase